MRKTRPRGSAISIVGMGYVGLATAVCFADRGYQVYGVDVDQEKLRIIASGKSPIHEAKIDSLLSRSLRNGNFSVSSDIGEAVKNSSITFVTVGTPSKSDGDIDLTYVESAVREIGKAIREKNVYHLVVVKSTVVPGTTAESILPIMKMSSMKNYPSDFGLCFNPEFLREGTAIEDTQNPDALIIGSGDDNSTKTLLSLFKRFYGEKLPYTLVTTTSNAEFVKYSVNTFRATQLSYLNSLANLCEKIPQTDVMEVTKGLSAVTKIDQRYLKSGLGFGGSCLPKDLRALIATSRKRGMEPTLLLSALEVNRKQPERAVEIAQELLGDLNGKKIALLGLTFKAGTDDVRESVAISIANRLIALGARIRAYDPKGIENARRILQNSVDYTVSALSCIEGADCCIVATDWDEFKNIQPATFKELMGNPLVIDGRRIFDSKLFESQNVLLYQLGQYQASSRRVAPIQVEHARN